MIVNARVVRDAGPLPWLWWRRSCRAEGEHETHALAVDTAHRHVRDRHRLQPVGIPDRPTCQHERLVSTWTAPTLHCVECGAAVDVEGDLR